MYKCYLSLLHVGLTLILTHMSFLCLTTTFYWYFFHSCVYVCFLFYVLCRLTWPSVACLLSCPSLNVARQSAEPWASKSTKVKLTHLPTTTRPPHHLPQTACHITHPHPHAVSIPQSKWGGLWVAESGPHPPTLLQRHLENALDVCAVASCFSSLCFPSESIQTVFLFCFCLVLSCLQHLLTQSSEAWP